MLPAMLLLVQGKWAERRQTACVTLWPIFLSFQDYLQQ